MRTGSDGGQRAPGGARESTRTLILVQMLLAALMLLAAALVVLSGVVRYPTLLVMSLAVTFATCAAALLINWPQYPKLLRILLPVLNAAAIGMLRESSPAADLGLLWIFPAIWTAWSFGLAATLGMLVSIAVAYWGLVALRDTGASATSAALGPLVIATLAVITQLVSRRVRAQQDLLQGQAQSLQHAVERARRQEDLVTDVLDAVDFEVVVYGADGRVVVANEAHHGLQALREHAGEKLYRADGYTPMDPHDQPSARASRGETFERELHWYGAPGRDRRALETTTRRLQDWRGQDVGIVMVSRDVTAEELAVRARADLVASVSHELRTPLTSILGFLELAAETEGLPAGTRRGLQIAERNAGRLLTLIGDILTTSAHSREGIALTVNPVPESLSEVVGAAIEAASDQASSRQMRIDATGVEPTWARIDVDRIRQVADNLISNAIKYGRDGGRIAVGVTSDGTHAWIVVRDDGPGISEQELPLLFDRFFRSDRVRNTSTHGSGLGLPISRDIARAHGGDITVQSAPDEGATFVVRLPAAVPGPGRGASSAVTTGSAHPSPTYEERE